MQITAHDGQDLATLARRVRCERQAKARDRLRCVLLALQGHTAPQIASQVGRSRRFVQRWCYAYRDRGLAGLTPRRQSGRPPMLDARQREQFKARVLAGPRDTDGVCTLRGRDFQNILEREFNKTMQLTAVYRLLHRLNLSCLKPRPRHRKTDPKAQQAWQEQAPLFSSK